MLLEWSLGSPFDQNILVVPYQTCLPLEISVRTKLVTSFFFSVKATRYSLTIILPLFRFLNSLLISRRSCLEHQCSSNSSSKFFQDILIDSPFTLVLANNFHYLSTPDFSCLIAMMVFCLLLESQLSNTISISQIQSITSTGVGLPERLGVLEAMKYLYLHPSFLIPPLVLFLLTLNDSVRLTVRL